MFRRYKIAFVAPLTLAFLLTACGGAAESTGPAPAEPAAEVVLPGTAWRVVSVKLGDGNDIPAPPSLTTTVKFSTAGMLNMYDGSAPLSTEYEPTSQGFTTVNARSRLGASGSANRTPDEQLVTDAVRAIAGIPGPAGESDRTAVVVDLQQGKLRLKVSDYELLLESGHQS